jgi:DNA-binding NtrC family response regulator
MTPASRLQSLSTASFISNPSLEESATPRILIVDDEPAIRSLYVNYLSERYTCFAAASVEEALVQLGINNFAVIITDVIMPGLSGIELLRKVMSSYPDTPVIMVSGVDRTQRARRGAARRI